MFGLVTVTVGDLSSWWWRFSSVQGRSRLKTHQHVLVMKATEWSMNDSLSPVTAPLTCYIVTAPSSGEQCLILSYHELHAPGLHSDISERLLRHPQHGLVLGPEQVGSPDQGQVATRHPRHLTWLWQVVQMMHQVGQSAEIVFSEYSGKIFNKLSNSWFRPPVCGPLLFTNGQIIFISIDYFVF